MDLITCHLCACYLDARTNQWGAVCLTCAAHLARVAGPTKPTTVVGAGWYF